MVTGVSNNMRSRVHQSRLDMAKKALPTPTCGFVLADPNLMTTIEDLPLVVANEATVPKTPPPNSGSSRTANFSPIDSNIAAIETSPSVASGDTAVDDLPLPALNISDYLDDMDKQLPPFDSSEETGGANFTLKEGPGTSTSTVMEKTTSTTERQFTSKLVMSSLKMSISATSTTTTVSTTSTTREDIIRSTTAGGTGHVPRTKPSTAFKGKGFDSLRSGKS